MNSRFGTLSAVLLAAIAMTPRPADASGSDPATCSTNGVAVNIEVQDLRNTKGELAVTIYGDRAEDFLAPGRKLVRKRLPVTGLTTRACLNVPGPGVYAIAVYHDENGDRRFGRTMLGLPAEGYGFSNDAPTLIGLPSFSDARFPVPAGGVHQTIHMRY